LLWLGDISFSLYLVHRIPQVALPRLIPAGHPMLGGGVGLVLSSTVLALVLAHFSYRYLERGVAQWLQRWLVRVIGAPQDARSTARVLPAVGNPNQSVEL